MTGPHHGIDAAPPAPGPGPDSAAGSEVVVYFGDDPLRAYQLRQWLPVFELLDQRHRVAIVVREPSTYEVVAAATVLPVVYLPTFGELTEMYRTSSAKVVVYVNNSARNFQSLVARSVLHVHVNHGESDKICMVSNQVKAYDQVFVAGDAAVNRHRATLIGFDEAKLVPVGRPQLDLRPAPLLPPSPRRTVLYAPTWEGEEPSNNYTSVDVMGPQVAAAILALPDVRMVYKPHPRVASSTTAGMLAGHQEIVRLIEEGRRRDPAAAHVVDTTSDILAIFRGCDAMITDVSSVGLDFLYLHSEHPLLITDRYGDRERLRRNAPVSRCADVVEPGDLPGLARLLAARLDHDEHRAARRAMRRYYFGAREVGESTQRFIEAISDAIALRDQQVRHRAQGEPGPAPSRPEAGTPAPAGPAPLDVTILAAGLGSRLGMPFPKPLTPLSDGRSILQQQLDNLYSRLHDQARVTVVVGFRPDLIMATVPDVRYVFNERFDRTNTSKSLLKALRAAGSGGMLWLNGDVVFDPGLLDRVLAMIRRDVSFVCVNTATVGEEEVKYRVDDDGFVTVLSKTVTDGLGEAVGINYIASADKPMLIAHLEGCTDQDYFERGIETAIAAGLKVRPVDISEYFVVEVDFTDDLERANEEVGKTVTSAA
ncbi:MAG TPA: NTP transferase domain-containing protein [Kineosporiaceae bacterium]